MNYKKKAKYLDQLVAQPQIWTEPEIVDIYIFYRNSNADTDNTWYHDANTGVDDVNNRPRLFKMIFLIYQSTVVF